MGVEVWIVICCGLNVITAELIHAHADADDRIVPLYHAGMWAVLIAAVVAQVIRAVP